jgi:uncharacterized damage-inducible protein DinB
MVRDLEALGEEIRLYPNEADMWKCPPGIANSTGTLVLHMAGNLRLYVGAQLGGVEYERDRPAEFSDRDIPLAELEDRIANAIDAVKKGLDALDEGELEQQYPLEVGGVRLKTGVFLTHLATHLAYHLGQVDYHRRVVTGQVEGVGAQSLTMISQ